MQRQRLKFLTSVGVTTSDVKEKQQQQEREKKREHLQALLGEDQIDLEALRAAIKDGALQTVEEGEGDCSDGDAAKEREGHSMEERETIRRLRSFSWKLLLAALPEHRKSRAFHARQQREWYADLHTAAETLCKTSPSPALGTASLRFIFHDAGLDEQTKSLLFDAASRLVLTLDLKQLVSANTSSAHAPASLSSWNDMSVCNSPHRSGEDESVCAPITASALPSAELDAIARQNGTRPILR